MNSAAQIFKAMSHPLRLEILDQIGASGELPVTEMRSSAGVSQSCMSQHLAVLRRADLVTTRKASQWVYYSLNTEKLLEAREALEGIDNTA